MPERQIRESGGKHPAGEPDDAARPAAPARSAFVHEQPPRLYFGDIISGLKQDLTGFSVKFWLKLRFSPVHNHKVFTPDVGAS
jgi:hypothetical protein